MNRIYLAAAMAMFMISCASSRPADEATLRARAKEYAAEFVIIDTHVDVPYRLREKMEDVSQRTADGQFDYPRAKEGGLDAPFMSIYIPPEYEMNGAKNLADTLIDMVETIARRSPDKFAMAISPADVTAHHKAGTVSFCLGMENGSPIEGTMDNLHHFYKRGIRYITLTHGKVNHISDSSYDSTRVWHGISPFGEKVVAEMNHLGIMVDVSHISDEAFEDVIRISAAPVIASHSSCRFFTPGFERNMSDAMIRTLAAKGGVIQINFGSSFLNNDYRLKDSVNRAAIGAYLKEHDLKESAPAAEAFIKTYRTEHAIGFFADVRDAAEHIDHVVKLVGIDHVGIGSDFDGVGDSLPTGLKDVSQYPNLIYELLKRGYSKSDIEKVCGENLLRVWTRVEQTAKKLQVR